MPKLSSNMYGADDSDFASGIANDALTNGLGTEDIWGAIQDDRATSRSNTGDQSTGPSDPDTPILRNHKAGNNESEAMDDSTKGGARHRPGPTGNAPPGPEKTSPPPANQNSAKAGKQRGPAYSNETA